ncbi:MAG: hypothetical protein AAGI70_06650, partial [Pseudomonadota bacterium]
MFAHLDRLGQDLYEGAAGIAERAASLVVSEVAIPVYVVHRGPDAEAYELFCDFSAFFTGDAVGLLRRPRLEVWAGRADLDRTRFARSLRDAFLAQFDEAKRIFRASHRTEDAFGLVELSQKRIAQGAGEPGAVEIGPPRPNLEARAAEQPHR